jgi:hypothetical protein
MMRLSRIQHAHLLIVVFLFVSCAAKRSEISLDTHVTSARVLMDSVEARGKRISSMVGRGTLSFESPEAAGSAWFQSSMKKPDSLLVMVQGPFGIELGSFFLSRNKYVVYSSLENKVVTGNPALALPKGVIPITLTVDQILDAFSGVLLFPTGRDEPARYSNDDEYFFLSFPCGADTCNYWVDPRYLLVAKYEVRDPQGRPIVEAEASWFTEQGSLAAAKRIVVTFPRDNRQLTVSYSALTLNAPNPRFDFTVPPTATTVEK